MIETSISTPVVYAAPGHPFRQVLDASTAVLSHRVDGRGTGIIQAKGVHGVELVRPGRGFDVPPGRFSLVHTHEGNVSRLMATPQTDYLDGLHTLDLLIELHLKISRRGWTQLRERPGRATRVARLPAARAERVGFYRYGTWRADLHVERTIVGGTPLAETCELDGDRYLVTLNVWTE